MVERRARCENTPIADSRRATWARCVPQEASARDAARELAGNRPGETVDTLRMDFIARLFSIERSRRRIRHSEITITRFQGPRGRSRRTSQP